MRFRLICGLIGLAILQCLDVIIAAPATIPGNGTHGLLVKRAPLSYCSADQNAMLDAAVTEIKGMVSITFFSLYLLSLNVLDIHSCQDAIHNGREYAFDQLSQPTESTKCEHAVCSAAVSIQDI
jgi:hypothetical protein